MKISDLELRTLNGRKVTILESKSGMGIGGAIIEGIGEVDASALSFVSGENIIKNAANLSEDKRKTIDRNFSYDAIKFYQPFEAVAIFDRESCDKLVQYRHTKHEAMKASAAERVKAYEASREAKYPGITELEKAHRDWAYYHEQFQRGMEDEYNDGVSMPTRPTSDINELSNKYPRAAMYLKADDYSCAANYNKASAGNKAKALLDAGGSIDEAQKILDNWLPEIWD